MRLQSNSFNAIINPNYQKNVMSRVTKTTEEVEPEEQSQQERQSLPPSQRVDVAYKLIYGEDAEVPSQHESIITSEASEWQIRHYMGGLFATPSNHLLTQRFSNVDEFLVWFNQAYPLQTGLNV